MEHAIGRKRVDPRWRDESEKSEADEKWMDGKVHSMGKESERERGGARERDRKGERGREREGKRQKTGPLE